ncbi:MAG: DJ-1/PfpI family protein, partial [Planctomycetales bacterium]|nr:DJ-1/PfpI family protein [Planctomycetales bacterium]
GVPIRPTMSFDDCRPAPEILFIPGGTDGTLAAMEDKQVRDFVAKMGAEATYVTSVCTGSLILGAAGLLNGYKATSHWLALKVLKEFGAEPLEQRVVVDRNRITGAGVTAGIDFALTLTSLLKDDDYAKSVQLMMEYDPQPPFESGNLKSASAESVKLLEAMADPFLEGVKATKVKIATQ